MYISLFQGQLFIFLELSALDQVRLLLKAVLMVIYQKYFKTLLDIKLTIIVNKNHTWNPYHIVRRCLRPI